MGKITQYRRDEKESKLLAVERDAGPRIGLDFEDR